MPRFELDPREADAFVRGMPSSAEWSRDSSSVYRLAVRGICAQCRGDRQFRERTDALVSRFRKELPAILCEARQLEAELLASVEAR